LDSVVSLVASLFISSTIVDALLVPIETSLDLTKLALAMLTDKMDNNNKMDNLFMMLSQNVLYLLQDNLFKLIQIKNV
jgi:hypothetical protein